MRGRSWLWAALVLTGVNCVAILDGEHPYRENEGVQTEEGGPCAEDSNCQDRLPCSAGTCLPDRKVCSYMLLDGVDAPASAQTPSDCLTIRCVAGDPITEPDAQDYKNDSNSCTRDECKDGVSTNEMLGDGSACTMGEKVGICNAGSCQISCTNNSDCDDGNPCSEDLCDTSKSKCAFTYLDGVLTPGAMQTAGDCKVRYCTNGIDGDISDEADVFVDGSSCTDDICTEGIPLNPPFNVKTMCPPVAPAVTGVCDGFGSCVECVDKDDCTNIVESECEKRSCVNNKCVIAYEGQSTTASPVLQQSKDCRRVVCSGMEMPLTVMINDNSDLPDDANPCTTDKCDNGVPLFTNVPVGTMCGANQVCTAIGICAGCNTPQDCSGTDDFCKMRTCTNNACGFSFTPNGTDLPMGQTAGDCKVLECDGAGNVKTSVLQSDVPVDGNQCTQDVCNAQGTPSNPPTAINSMCSVGANNACDGAGNCKKALGLTCAAGNECVSTRCVDGVCCNNSCVTMCEACNVAGSLGTCTAVPKGQDDGMCIGTTQSCNGSNNCDAENGISCAANTSCLSNFCVDGVCCNNACDTTCKSCSVMGAVGTCSNLPAGSSDSVPTNLCIGGNQCDGNGTCRKVNGGTCTLPAQCLSGNCVDGYCCDTTCTADCKACNVAALLGTCSNVPSGQDDGACTGAALSCDGVGTCKAANGTACMVGSACLSGNCMDGVCCNTMCAGTCRACNLAGSVGTCTHIPAGTDPSNECAIAAVSTCGNDGFCDGTGSCQKYAAGTVCVAASCMGGTQSNADTCNGIGTCVDSGNSSCLPYICGMTTCKTSCTMDVDCAAGFFCNASVCVAKFANGQACTSANSCTSGNCTDSVCCNSNCGATCKACNLPGLVGTCSNVPQLTDDGTCVGVNTCDGLGTCKLDDGQSCLMDSQCASNICAVGTNVCVSP